MSEKIIHPETPQSHEHHHDNKHHEQINKAREQASEKAKKEQSEVNLDALRKVAETHAESATTHKSKEDKLDTEDRMVFGVQKSLKSNAYNQTIQRIQTKLKNSDKMLSKIVHNKTIESISNIGANTVAKPSGLLGGSIVAFFGSTILLYSAKHYGYRYNFLMFFILFVAGFIIGLLLEILIWIIRGRKNSH